jgi:hypothetical protein
MKIRTGSHYLAMAALILMAALAVPEAAPNSCAGYGPGCFKGTFQGEDAHLRVEPGATSVVISTTATGTATHLGRFTLRREITGDLTNLSATGSAEWIAANGDSIVTTISGQAIPSDVGGGSLKVTEVHVITGGTGRFTGVQGRFTVELFHRFEISGVVGDIETHDIFGSFHETVAFPRGRG